jgi:protein required for attachment to host cells
VIPLVSLKHGAWVLVCDGRKALILEATGKPTAPHLVLKEEKSVRDAAAHDLGTDRPGRVYQSVGAKRSSVEETDRHVEAERLFLRDVAARLDAALLAGEVEDLVVVAPPKALGMLRAEFSRRVKAAVRSEVDKDLVSVPVGDILPRITS